MELLQGAQGVQQLNVAAMTFMLNSVAPSTSQQYSSHLKQYVDFCQLRNLTAFPLYQQNLVLFAAQLAKSLSHSGIQGHLVAIKFMSAVHGFSNPNTFPSFPRLYLTLRVTKRLQGSTHKKKRRRWITPTLLKVLHCNLLNSSMLYEDKLMMWAAMLTAFFGFLRISEYTSVCTHSFDNQHHTLLQGCDNYTSYFTVF